MGSGIYYTRHTVNRHEYDTWGYNSKAPTYNYDPEYRATEPYFTGHPYDGSLNLYYVQNRFYDAQDRSLLKPGTGKEWTELLQLLWQQSHQLGGFIRPGREETGPDAIP